MTMHRRPAACWTHATEPPNSSPRSEFEKPTHCTPLSSVAQATVVPVGLFDVQIELYPSNLAITGAIWTALGMRRRRACYVRFYHGFRHKCTLYWPDRRQSLAHPRCAEGAQSVAALAWGRPH